MLPELSATGFTVLGKFPVLNPWPIQRLAIDYSQGTMLQFGLDLRNLFKQIVFHLLCMDLHEILHGFCLLFSCIFTEAGGREGWWMGRGGGAWGCRAEGGLRLRLKKNHVPLQDTNGKKHRTGTDKCYFGTILHYFEPVNCSEPLPLSEARSAGAIASRTRIL